MKGFRTFLFACAALLAFAGDAQAATLSRDFPQPGLMILMAWLTPLTASMAIYWVYDARNGEAARQSRGTFVWMTLWGVFACAAATALFYQFYFYGSSILFTLVFMAVLAAAWKGTLLVLARTRLRIVAGFLFAVAVAGTTEMVVEPRMVAANAPVFAVSSMAFLLLLMVLFRAMALSRRLAGKQAMVMGGISLLLFLAALCLSGGLAALVAIILSYFWLPYLAYRVVMWLPQSWRHKVFIGLFAALVIADIACGKSYIEDAAGYYAYLHTLGYSWFN